MQEFNINDDISKVNEISNNEKKIVKVQKTHVLAYVSDATGCGHIRGIFPFSYINAVFGKSGTIMPLISHTFLFQHDLLILSRSMFFQRQMSEAHYNIIKKYKEMQPSYKFRMIYDIDDLLWGKNEKQGGDKFHGIPSYNFAWERVTDENKKFSIEIAKLMDLVTVSTPYLAEYLKEKVAPIPIQVVPNTVPKFLYGLERRIPIEKRIEKPVVLYAGAPGHYSNPNKLKGDLDNAWCDYIIKAVKDDKIIFKVMGGLPWFWEEIKDKIITVSWTNMFFYPNTLRAQKADIIFMPLVPNEFNSSKSDIKYIESCAVSAVGIGTYFTNGMSSPYDNNIIKMPDNCTIEQIEEKIKEVCEPDIFNSIIQRQYDMLENDGRYTESAKNIKLYTSIF